MTVVTYLIYLLIAVPLTIWVARTLSRNGRIFLVDVFHGNEDFADAVNRLLVVGFYLVNLGFVTLFLRTGSTVVDARGVIEQLSVKVGIVMVVLGVLHLLNVWTFNAIRRRSRLEEMTTPPVPPNTFVGTGPFQPPFAGTQQPMPSGY
jgi:cytochrome b561